MLEMALKTRLSDYSRQKLVENIDTDWFRELLEVMRNCASCAEKQYGVVNPPRPLSQLEHQAFNGIYREGSLLTVELIPALAQPPKEKPPEPPPQFGRLIPTEPNPKDLSQVPKPK